MTYEPNPTVTIEGVDFTGETIGSVRIVRGRTNVYEPPRPGYASIDLVDLTGAGIYVDVGTTLEVAVDDSAGNPVPLFTGTVSDWQSSLYDSGIGGTPAAITRLTAVGILARLGRRQIFDGGRPVEDDGDRIRDAIGDGLATTWEEQPLTLAWQDVDPTLTWDTYDPYYDPSIIDPGVYQLAALDPSDSGYSSLEVIGQSAFSGDGIIYETATGSIGYADAFRREQNATAGYLTVTGDVIVADTLRTSSSLADLVNRAVVTYDGGAVTATEVVSLSTFGLFTTRIETNLATLLNAGDRADRYVENHAYPAVTFDAFDVRLDTITDDTLRDLLLGLEINAAVELAGLPDTLLYTQFPGFVEGLEWQVDRGRVRQRITLSDAQLSIGSVRWEQVPQNLEWGQVSATLQWKNARSV